MGWACSRKGGGGRCAAKGQDVSLSWPCLACPLALPTLWTAQRRHEMSTAVPLGWGAAPCNTRWMRSAGEPQSPGDGHTWGFTWLEPHLLLCLVCKGRRGGLAQERHPISGRNKTSAYLMQLCSSCEGWRGAGHGKGPRGPHRHVVMWLPPHFCKSQVNTGYHNWKTWRTVFCIVHKTNYNWVQVLGSPWDQRIETRKFAHPVNPLGIQRSRWPGKRENFLQQFQHLLRQEPLKLH